MSAIYARNRWYSWAEHDGGSYTARWCYNDATGSRGGFVRKLDASHWLRDERRKHDPRRRNRATRPVMVTA